MYFAFPPNWIAFVMFAVAMVLGRKVVRSRTWRTVGVVALAVVVLMPVKVPTFVGAIYMPHGFVQMYDFDPHYYFPRACIRARGRTVHWRTGVAGIAAGAPWVGRRAVELKRNLGEWPSDRAILADERDFPRQAADCRRATPSHGGCARRAGDIRVQDGRRRLDAWQALEPEMIYEMGWR